MSTQEYIDSGILELYVYGCLNTSEIEEVNKMAQQFAIIREEILVIEKSLLLLSSSVAPRLSGKNYEVIKQHIFDSQPKATPIQPAAKAQIKLSQYLGWAAALLFLAGTIYFYQEGLTKASTIAKISVEKVKLNKEYTALQSKNQVNEDVLTIVRDVQNTVVPLAGQEASPTAVAKVYWNQETHTVYVDGAGLPEPPEGMVYQVWALKLNPLTPLSIGLLDNYNKNENLIFPLHNVIEAEAFGITLEPAGGSASPTLEQLFTLGKV
jgi:anti-sigma-K factor RskA